MSFAEVLKQVKSMSYETIIFDTAPTGHTLRFLQFPTVMEKALSKVSQLSRQFGPMLNGFLGGGGRLPNGQSMDELVERVIVDPKLNDRATLLLLARSRIADDA